VGSEKQTLLLHEEPAGFFCFENRLSYKVVRSSENFTPEEQPKYTKEKNRLISYGWEK
jgi:hypothetical protein